MTAVTLTKTPARSALPPCPDWCARDHAGDIEYLTYHASEFEHPADNWGFTARATWSQHTRPQDAALDRIEVNVSSGGGGFHVKPEQARQLAKVLESLGKPGEAEVVRGAARLAERAVKELAK